MARNLPSKPEEIEISVGVSVSNVLECLENKDKFKLSNIIQNRFQERYLDPLLNSNNRNGFAMAGIGCLLIESLESFHNGWNSSYGHEGGKILIAFLIGMSR